MKAVLVYVSMIFFLITPRGVFAQKNTNISSGNSAGQKKYTSLLWEISGNGLKKPSYLFGTMHISNKMVFNLGDSFYTAIKAVDVVALEQNPEVWQEAFSKEDYSSGNNFLSSRFLSQYNIANDRLTQQTFLVSNYESKIELGLASEARMVNGMLYRNNIGMEDFEEETYLDMYIFRLGHKLDKIVTGVEDYKESNKLVKEAYMAMYKDKKQKRNINLGGYQFKKEMEDAYRKGDLDALDSLEVLSVVSDAFEEKFLFRRNEIQANSIDTILKKHSLFVGVGAAHLPGERGVIELLRKKGYTLRPVIMGQRDSEEKDKLEKIRVPVVFTRQYAEDSLFSVEIPGNKFFRFNSAGQTNMVQYADMPNGSYYMVTRIKTDASLIGNSAETVLKKTDSLLYENIPGKILSKKPISKNGYKGYDIINRTRKGDKQRYNIYILPDELVIFKVSGLNDYVTGGNEADQFFSSIAFDSSSYKQGEIFYQPPYGGFKAKFSAKPMYIANERNDKNRSEWLSTDENGNAYFIFKANIHQYDYIEEDSFELRLMEESFKSSKVFKKPEDGKTSSWNGYPVINASYTHTDGSQLKLRYLIQGANYYIIGSKYKGNAKAADDFINSFSLTQNYYGPSKERKDSVIGFTVNSPLFYPAPDSSDNSSMQDLIAMANENADDEASSYMDVFKTFSIKSIGNDTTGEHIALVSIRFPKYTYMSDSSDFMKSMLLQRKNDSDYIIKTNKKYTTSSNWSVNYYQFTDTGSSRILTIKSFYKNGVLFYLANMSDSVRPQSEFVKQFFETFTPADTFKTFNISEKKSKLLFADYFSSDSVIRKKAIQAINASLFDSSDLPQVKQAINQLSWKNKNYLQLKKKWISVVGGFHDTASVNYLSQLYSQVKDTSDLQNEILDALLDIRTDYSFSGFKDLIISEPPALTSSPGRDYAGFNMNSFIDAFSGRAKIRSAGFYGYKWPQLYDTLALSSKILPSLLDLITLDDYKDDIMQVLTYTVDSGYLHADDYKQYFNKFLIEAKQQLKKQLALEEKKEMNKLDRDNDNSDSYDYMYQGRKKNHDLENYAILLMPFWERSAEVPAFFEKLLQLRDKDIKMEAGVLLLKNNRPLADSILLLLAADESYRLRLYNALKEINLTNKFPVKYKNQQAIAQSALKTSLSYAPVDSLSYVDKLQVKDAKHTGWVYFFKYKNSKDDAEWKIASSGLQPMDTSKINTDFNSYKEDFIQYTNEVYNKNTAKEKFAEILKEDIYSLRESASRFYNDDGDDDEMVDVVKERRYE